MPEMTTPKLKTPWFALDLVRPGSSDRALRAWDAADELLLDAAANVVAGIDQPRVLVIDDQFGALTLGLAQLRPQLVADSATLPEALAINARRNPDLPDPPVCHDWQAPPEGPFDLVVLRIPRQSDYLAWLLRWVNGVLAPNGALLAGGMIKHLPSRSVDVFAEAVHTETVLPARKKARVVICRAGSARLAGWSGAWKDYGLADGIRVGGMPAVFARERLDIGTRLLLPRVAEAAGALAPATRVLDLACGNGVLGLQALATNPGLNVTFCDVSSQAVVSARRNLALAFPEATAEVRHADGVPAQAGRFGLILLNPPFHEGGVVGDHIALRLFRQASKHLAPEGRVLIVGNRHLGYHQSLKRYFAKVTQLDADPKFVVFAAGRS